LSAEERSERAALDARRRCAESVGVLLPLWLRSTLLLPEAKAVAEEVEAIGVEGKCSAG
jgi:hypothetical protein